MQNENQETTLATIQKPNDIYYSKLNAILKEKVNRKKRFDSYRAFMQGKQPVEDRREVPMPILRQCIEELIRETPADLLSRFDFIFVFLSTRFSCIGNSGAVVRVLDYGIRMFKITGRYFCIYPKKF